MVRLSDDTGCLESRGEIWWHHFAAMTTGGRGREGNLCAVITSRTLGVHRVELQLNRKFLAHYGIKDIFEFHRMVRMLPEHHILFAKLDERKTRRHLRNRGHSESELRQIIEHVRDCDGDLQAQCAVLRRRGRLTNIRRLLVPLRTNALVVKALKRWAKQWPKAPIRLGGTND